MSNSFDNAGASAVSRSASDKRAGHSDCKGGGSTAPSSPEPARIVAADGRHGVPRDRSSPDQTEVTNWTLQTSGETMSQYSVGFYNETSDSTGHNHHVCQREVEVAALSADQALTAAVTKFESREDVSTWRDRAQSIECTRTGGES